MARSAPSSEGGLRVDQSPLPAEGRVVYYPFPRGHKHAGKYWKGTCPEGNVGDLQRQAGFLTEPPGPGLLVTEVDVLLEELATAEQLYATLRHELTQMGKTALLATAEAFVTDKAAQTRELAAVGQWREGRNALAEIEEQNASLQKQLANVVPVAVLQPVAAAAPAAPAAAAPVSATVTRRAAAPRSAPSSTPSSDE